MMRLLLFVSILCGCSAIAPMFTAPADPVELKIVEMREGRTLRRALVQCNYPIDELDTLDAVAIADSSQWVFTDARFKVDRTALCARVLAEKPQTGCACTGLLCVHVDGQPLCQPEDWRALIEKDVWQSPSLAKIRSQHRVPDGALRLRWSLAKQVVVEYGARSHFYKARWLVIDTAGVAHRCTASQPFELDLSSVERYAEKPMFIETGGAGCVVRADHLRVAASLMANVEAIALELQVHVPREWRKPTERYNTWWIRASASRPGR